MLRWKSCFESQWLLLLSGLMVSAVAGAKGGHQSAQNAPLADTDLASTDEQSSTALAASDAGPGDAAVDSPSLVEAPQESVPLGADPEGDAPAAIHFQNPADVAEPAWVLARPSIADQVEKGDKARNGIDPCATPDPGYGGYQQWVPLPGTGWILLPKASAVDASGGFNVLFHFHGHEPARKEWVKVMKRSVLVAFDLGTRSDAYAQEFETGSDFSRLVRKVEDQVSRAYHHPGAHAAEIGLSSWSAGYGAAGRILSQSTGSDRVRDLIVLDGLHTGYRSQNLDAERLEPFTQFAERAATGNAFMFVSHSSIVTRGFASTTETANLLVWEVGGRTEPATARPTDPMGLELLASYNKGDFHVRGFRGGGTKDHCAQLALLGDVLRAHIKPRWEAH